MSNTKFTPGPWRWDDVRSEIVTVATKPSEWTGDPEPVATIVETDSGYYPPRGADRYLIAAAPELFEELQNQLEAQYNPFEPDNQSRSYLRIKALLAKATGEQP